MRGEWRREKGEERREKREERREKGEERREKGELVVDKLAENCTTTKNNNYK